MEVVKDVGPPTGLRRLLFRLPIHLYRLGLGGLLGRRLLLLHHIGRVTGRPRRVVLEVVTHDRAEGCYVVASGWGPTAAWYRNVLHTPDVTVQVAWSTLPVRAVPLSEEEGAEVFARYAAAHRRTARYLLPRLMGYSVDGSDADFRAVGRRIPFVRFEPRT
jgi:deazaflavin-dependent oxidoreductase (nitroreductase family)